MNSFWHMVSNKRPKFEELGNSFSLPSGNAETPSHESRALRANWTGFGFGQTWFQICLLFIGSSILVRDSWLQKNRNSLKPVRVKKGIMLRLLGTSRKWGAGSRSAVEFVQSVPWTGGGQTAGDGPEIYIVHHREEKRNLSATVSKAWTEALPARKGRVEPDPAGTGKCLAQLSSLLAPRSFSSASIWVGFILLGSPGTAVFLFPRVLTALHCWRSLSLCLARELTSLARTQIWLVSIPVFSIV